MRLLQAWKKRQTLFIIRWFFCLFHRVSLHVEKVNSTNTILSIYFESIHGKDEKRRERERKREKKTQRKRIDGE